MRFFTITAVRASLAAGLCLAATLAWAQRVGALEVSQAWLRPTVAGQTMGAGYLVVTNAGKVGDRLVAARSALAERVELHTMWLDGDVMRMRAVESLEVPAGATVALQPGGMHLMLMGLKAPLAAGQRVTLTLQFEKAGEVAVQAAVRAPGGAAEPAEHKHH